MKRKLAVVLAALMTLGSFTTVQAAKITFSDIDNVPWAGAVTYINGAAEAGLMVGDTDSKGNKVFRAKDQVTYCETMQLAYSILKAGGSLGDTTGFTTKWKAVMDGYNIPTWARDCVAYGLEKNILSVSDVSRFMASATKNNYAKREDVAVIFGKALVTRTSYTSSANPTLNYADKSKIASTSVPYVELLNRLDLMVGDNNNNFNPRNDINRAEMAVLSLKTYNLLTGSGTGTTTPTGDNVRGIVNTINTVGTNTLLTLETASGSRSFLGTTNVSCTMESSGSSISFSELAQGDVITVYYSGTDIKSIVVHSKVATTTKSGTIDQISSTRIYLLGSGSLSSGYDLASGCTVTLNDSSSTLKELIEETEYYDVEATLTLNSSNEVTRIVAKSTEGSGTKGTLVSLSSSTVRLKRSSNTTSSYTLARDVIYRLDGEDSTYSKVSRAIDENSKVSATLYFNDNDEVVRIYASTTSTDAPQGVISSSISSTSFRMKPSGSSSTKTYYLASSCTYRLDGATSTRTKLNDAIDRYGEISVTLTMNEDGDVTRITATTTSGKTGTISTRISSSLKIVLSGKSSSTTYLVSSDCDYTLDGSRSDRGEVNDAIADYDSVEATLTLDEDDRVIKVAASTEVSSVKGTISSAMTESYLRIKISGKSSTTRYYLDDDTVYKLDGSSSSWSRVNRAIDNYGSVTATLELDGDTVTRLTATTDEEDSGDGVVGYLDDSEIQVDGTRYYLASDVTVSLNGSSTSLSRLIEYFDFGDEMDATLTLDSRDEVTRIRAYTRRAEGDLRGVYTDTMEISLRQDGNTRTFSLKDTSSSSCKYYVNGDEMGGVDFFYDEVIGFSGTVEVVLTLDRNGLVTKVEADKYY